MPFLFVSVCGRWEMQHMAEAENETKALSVWHEKIPCFFLVCTIKSLYSLYSMKQILCNAIAKIGSEGSCDSLS